LLTTQNRLDIKIKTICSIDILLIVGINTNSLGLFFSSSFGRCFQKLGRVTCKSLNSPFILIHKFVGVRPH
jgi:hypothetical protein